MIFHEPKYPWLFHRDEVDLFEDELEDLYEKFAGTPEGEPMTDEAEILQEQIDTEDASDAELTLKLGMDMLHDAYRSPPPAGVQTDHEEDEDECALSIRRHPLYQRARVWATEVRTVAKQGYLQGGVHRRNFFRVYANANLFPTKIFTALGEEMHDDRLGQMVAQEEYLLAMTYLERMRDSLSHILYSVEDGEVVRRLQTQAEVLKQAILSQLTALRRRNKML